MTKTTALVVRQPPSQYTNLRDFGAHVDVAIVDLTNPGAVSGDERAGQLSQTTSRLQASDTIGSFIKFSPPWTSLACEPSHV